MWRFLDRLYGFKGAKKTFDAVAIHPYSPNIKGIEYQLKKRAGGHRRQRREAREAST